MAQSAGCLAQGLPGFQERVVWGFLFLLVSLLNFETGLCWVTGLPNGCWYFFFNGGGLG